MTSECKGYLSLVFHAHLPYVRHPEHELFLEEDWLYESITETYIPLLNVLERLVDDKVPHGLTVSLSPTLVAMLRDPLLQDRYVRHIERLIELAGRELERTRWEPAFNRLARMYLRQFESAREYFVDRCGRDLTVAFRNLQEHGGVELIPCAATHGYLPLMALVPEAVRAQVLIAARSHEKCFGRRPQGMWLPECGYYPGVDKFLKEAGVRYFFTDSHGILHATPRPRMGVFAPILCPSLTAAFGRDIESSKQVWSSVEGYPGDHRYREFYRDIGYDMDYDYIRPYVGADGSRKNTGIKYHRITGPTSYKEVYQPDAAGETAAAHAGNFMFNRQKQVEYLFEKMGGRRPVLVAPYDAELFGHWWYDGPQWVDFLVRKIAFDQRTLRLITPGQYLDENPQTQMATPSESSWGWKGYSEVWLGGSNDWIYPHLHVAAQRMVELAGSFRNPTPIEHRALSQAARELLLAQGSDWAFIMKTGTMVPYAIRRTKEHLGRFTELYHSIKSHSVDPGRLEEMEWKDNIFSDIDYTLYARS
ncbi:MAG: 1,4-alpha-glucan branching protein domain-containing protein [Candidatus Eisenbacteria bacterium]